MVNVYWLFFDLKVQSEQSSSGFCLSRRATSHYPPSASAASPEPMRILSRSYRQVVPSRSV